MDKVKILDFIEKYIKIVIIISVALSIGSITQAYSDYHYIQTSLKDASDTGLPIKDGDNLYLVSRFVTVDNFIEENVTINEGVK